MFGFSSSKKSVSKAKLVFDIGSKSVGGGIFDKTSSGKARLIHTLREPIAFKSRLTGDKFQVAMLSSLRRVLFHLDSYGVMRARSEQKSIHRFDSIAVFLSSPWHASETKLLTLQMSKPAVITKSLVDDLINEEEKSFEKKLAEAGQGEGGFDLLERKIIEIRLNGYPTTKPYGKTADKIEVMIFESVAPTSVIGAIKSAIGKRFPSDHIEFHTFSAAAFASLRDLFPKTEDFLIVQVGGEMTDISLIKKGVILGIVSFPLGHNGLLRSLSEICENHPDCALETLITLHRESSASDCDTEKVERAIAGTKMAWLKQFNSAISNFSSETFLPKSVFLFEDSPYARLFEKFLAELGSDQFTAVSEPFSVTVIGHELAATFADIQKGILPDPAISVESGFIASL